MVFLDDKIRIQRVLKDKLDKKKTFKRETFNSVIARLIYGTTFIPVCEKCNKEAHFKKNTPDGIAYYCSEKHAKDWKSGVTREYFDAQGNSTSVLEEI